ncbi:MAG TPA: hypothetical protein VGJ29_11715 [Vicinamibacterales bacterium]
MELRPGPEVEQQTDLELRRPQVADELSLGKARQLLGRFELDNHAVVYDQIESLPGYVPLLVVNGNQQLSDDHVPAIGELVSSAPAYTDSAKPGP